MTRPLEGIGRRGEFPAAIAGVEAAPLDLHAVDEQALDPLQKIGPGRTVATHGGQPRRLVAQALGTRGAEHGMRPDLEIVGDPKCRERFYPLGEAHRLAHLRKPVVRLTHLVGGGQSAADVGGEREPARMEARLRQRRGQYRQRRLHPARMGAVGHRKHLGPAALALHEDRERGDRLGGAAGHEVLRGVVAGDFKVANRRQAAIDHVARRRNGDHRAPPGAERRAASARDHDTHGVFQRHDPGGIGGGVFAQAMAEGGHGLDPPRAPQRQQSDLQGEARRLDNQRILQRRRIVREHRGQQVAVQVRCGRGGASVQRLAKRRRGLVELSAHAREMRALAGEEEGDFGRGGADLARSHEGRGLALSQGVERGGEVLGLLADDRRATNELGPAGIGCMAEVRR